MLLILDITMFKPIFTADSVETSTLASAFTLTQIPRKLKFQLPTNLFVIIFAENGIYMFDKNK